MSFKAIKCSLDMRQISALYKVAGDKPLKEKMSKLIKKELKMKKEFWTKKVTIHIPVTNLQYTAIAKMAELEGKKISKMFEEILSNSEEFKRALDEVKKEFEIENLDF